MPIITSTAPISEIRSLSQTAGKGDRFLKREQVEQQRAAADRDQQRLNLAAQSQAFNQDLEAQKIDLLREDMNFRQVESLIQEARLNRDLQVERQNKLETQRLNQMKFEQTIRNNDLRERKLTQENANDERKEQVRQEDLAREAMERQAELLAKQEEIDNFVQTAPAIASRVGMGDREANMAISFLKSGATPKQALDFLIDLSAVSANQDRFNPDEFFKERRDVLVKSQIREIDNQIDLAEDNVKSLQRESAFNEDAKRQLPQAEQSLKRAIRMKNQKISVMQLNARPTAYNGTVDDYFKEFGINAKQGIWETSLDQSIDEMNLFPMVNEQAIRIAQSEGAGTFKDVNENLSKEEKEANAEALKSVVRPSNDHINAAKLLIGNLIKDQWQSTFNQNLKLAGWVRE